MADSDGNSISGYLQKRGEKGPIKGYKRRWFVFDGSAAEKQVFYYPSREDLSSHLGFIPLDQVTEIRKTANLDFEVITPTRTYFLQAPTEKELEQWVNALRPNIGSNGSVSSAASSDAMREKDETIAKLEEKVRALEGGGGDEGDLRKELMATKEEFERYKKTHGAGGGGGDTGELAKKDTEIQALKKEISSIEEKYGEELIELKKEYFRACAIGIVQQRKITKDLPPVAELYKRCLDDNTEWKDYVPWIKTTLPKK
jgi:hypothetical protein